MKNANRTYLCCYCKTTKRLQAWIINFDETLCPICQKKMDYLGTTIRIPKNTHKNWKAFANWLEDFYPSEHNKLIAEKIRGSLK